MIRSLYTGFSGVKSHQTRMDVIGNNIANVNTTGFKTGRATFADIFSQNVKGATASEGNIGSTNAKQVGLGTMVAGIDTIFRDGAPMATGKNTDLCLSGDGLFVVKSGNETYYTRNGGFEFDKAGNYVLPGSGHFVQGWTATDGVIDTTGAIGNIKIDSVLAATPTTKVDFKYNLDADTALGIWGEEITTVKVTKTETIWEEVGDINVLEQKESRYNLNVTIGDSDYILHNVTQNDIDLSKNWTVKSIDGAVTNSLSSTAFVTLEDDDGNTSRIRPIAKGTSNIKVGDTFSADTSRLRLRSTVNEVSPLPFIVDGVNYNAISMDHSVEIPGEGWRVTSVSPDGSYMYIKQYENGVANGCTVGIGLDLADDQPLPQVGSELKFDGDVIAAITPKRQVTVETETYEDIVTPVLTSYNSEPVASSVNIYDSSGNTYQIPVYFVCEGELAEDGSLQSTNKWLVSLANSSTVKVGDTTTYEFVDANGNKSTATMPAVELEFDDAGNITTDITGLMTLSYGNGTEGLSGTTQDVTLDFSAVTQYDENTTVTASGDGSASATLKALQVDSNGIITGTYTNGLVRPEAQVALAHFNNSPGLVKTGTNLYQASANSGTPLIIHTGEYGTTILPGYLEMSNVEVAEEFSNMIITQRGFQANSKIITVSDELLETAVNMKR
ncbi:MAG: flagellar hook-basal body complex protein [Selenomonadaceae bacterium]|nr:flagellar hook-basal body complex protein [Selenomonadaceae bacterium]